MSALEELREELGRITDLERAAAVLSWDQETYMPAGGVEDRSGQLATLVRLAHEHLVSDRTGILLERASADVAGLPEDSFEAALVRVTTRDRDRRLRVPGELVAEIAREESMSRPVWVEARARSDWRLFAPRMRVTVDLTRRLADALGHGGRAYDALIEESEPGLTTGEVEAMFDRLRAAVTPLLARVAERADRVDDGILDLELPEAGQVEFSDAVVRKLGFDFQRGRRDVSAHPFCIAFGPGDVRMTTRVRRTLRDSCLFSTVHESGHGMYEQGIPRELARTPLAGGASPGVHESQSRLWENLVGRGRPFWTHFGPAMRAAFPGQLAGVSDEAIYRACNRVRPSYIRVDADELTYNLHIMLRFEIEKELLEGSLDVDGVPEAWNARLTEYLGLAPVADADGPLQDIHWTNPVMGGFVGYALGNMIGAQMMETIRAELPDLDDRLAGGDFSPLLDWLRSRVYVHGRKFTPNELIRRVTGRPIGPEPWIAYVTEKFGRLYGLTG